MFTSFQEMQEAAMAGGYTNVLVEYARNNVTIYAYTARIETADIVGSLGGQMPVSMHACTFSSLSYSVL